jgi:hypothetical protein
MLRLATLSSDVEPMNRTDFTKKMRAACVSWGKGGRHPLRFSKSGNSYLEELFSTHYVSPALASANKARSTEPPAPVPAATPPIQPPHPKNVHEQEKNIPSSPCR